MRLFYPRFSGPGLREPEGFLDPFGLPAGAANTHIPCESNSSTDAKTAFSMAATGSYRCSISPCCLLMRRQHKHRRSLVGRRDSCPTAPPFSSDAFDWLMFRRYYGMYHGNTFKGLFYCVYWSGKKKQNTYCLYYRAPGKIMGMQPFFVFDVTYICSDVYHFIRCYLTCSYNIQVVRRTLGSSK